MEVVELCVVVVLVVKIEPLWEVVVPGQII